MDTIIVAFAMQSTSTPHVWKSIDEATSHWNAPIIHTAVPVLVAALHWRSDDLEVWAVDIRIYYNNPELALGSRKTAGKRLPFPTPIEQIV